VKRFAQPTRAVDTDDISSLVFVILAPSPAAGRNYLSLAATNIANPASSVDTIFTRSRSDWAVRHDLMVRLTCRMSSYMM
jgi:hypothetical protein